MPDYSLLTGVLAVLLSAFAGGLMARFFRQPLIFGYLLAGLVVSGFAHHLGLNRGSLSLLAEIGLALLMFTLGLEFSFNKINQLKKVVVWGAILQIAGTTLLGSLFLINLFGLNFCSALVAGAAFSLSSTAIVVKILNEKARRESLSGGVMIGWLLIQDLAVLPMIGLLPVLFAKSGFRTGLFQMVGAVLLLGVTWIVARKIVPPLVDLVAGYRSRELLLIFVIAILFLFALFSSSFGFSFGLGAFLAGLILSQTAENTAVFSEIRPLRDVFLAVFFVSLGLSLEPGFLITNWWLIILISLFFMLLKILLVNLILLRFHYHAKTLISCSFGLAQVGEFAFVLASTALAGKYINSSVYYLTASVALFSMVVTPWIFAFADKFYFQADRWAKKFPRFHQQFFAHYDQLSPAEELPFKDHVVILGYGRVGRSVGDILEKSGISYLVVDYNPEIVRNLKLEGKEVVFGDPTEIDVLDLAQVDKARLVIIAIPDSQTQKIIIANCRSLNRQVTVICRSHFEDDWPDLRKLGAAHLIHPEFEAALSIGHRALQIFGFDRERIQAMIKTVKTEHTSA